MTLYATIILVLHVVTLILTSTPTCRSIKLNKVTPYSPIIPGIAESIVGEKTSVNTVQQEFLVLEDGLRFEVLTSKASLRRANGVFWKNSNRRSPLVFIHGSGGGAWIYAENWMPFFSRMGFDCYALGLRGSYATGMVSVGNSTSVKIKEHLNDINQALLFINRRTGKKPILIGHSFGGLILTKILESRQSRSMLSGAAWLCSLPPSGQAKMALRFFRNRFFQSINIIRGLAFGQAKENIRLSKLLFFDKSTSDTAIKFYMKRLSLDALIGEDIKDLEYQLPSNGARDTKAPWLSESNPGLKTFVLGAKSDYIVDPEAIMETASFVGAYPSKVKLVEGPGHNVMLGGSWKITADELLDWIENEFMLK